MTLRKKKKNVATTNPCKSDLVGCKYIMSKWQTGKEQIKVMAYLAKFIWER